MIRVWDLEFGDYFFWILSMCILQGNYSLCDLEAYNFGNLDEFLALYYQGMSVLAASL